MKLKPVLNVETQKEALDLSEARMHSNNKNKRMELFRVNMSNKKFSGFNPGIRLKFEFRLQSVIE